MTTFDDMRRLLNEKYLNEISGYKGDLGELLAIAHFEKINQGFIHVHQEKWSYPLKMKETNAKRPDFYMIPMVNKMTVIDVKHHNLNDNMDFILDVNEIIKYLELEAFLIELHKGICVEPGYIDIKFFVIPSQLNGEAFAEISLIEIANAEMEIETTLPGNKTIVNTYFIISIKDRLIKLGTKDERYVL